MNKYNVSISADSTEALDLAVSEVSDIIDNHRPLFEETDALSIVKTTDEDAVINIAVNGAAPATANEEPAQEGAAQEVADLVEYAGVLWRKVERDIRQGDALIVVEEDDDDLPVGFVTVAGKVDDDSTVKVFGNDGYDQWCELKFLRPLEPVAIKR
jgi:hypothetical protein